MVIFTSNHVTSNNFEQLETNEIYRFGSFRLDARERLLHYDGKPVRLAPKRFELLLYFVENAGRVATKGELLDAVWSDTFVEEATLARNISTLRKKLGKFEGGKDLIETVPKIGYRFKAEVTSARPAEEQNARNDEQIIEFDDEATEESEAGEQPGGSENEYEERQASRFPPPAVSSPRSFIAPALLFVLIAVVALAGSAYLLYQTRSAQSGGPAGLQVRSNVSVENITVDAARGIVDSGIAVQPGDVIEISAGGTYRPATIQMISYTDDGHAGAPPEYPFPDADPGAPVGWIGTWTDQSDYFQVGERSSITAETSGNLYFAINERKGERPEGSGSFAVSVTLTRRAASERPAIRIGSVVHLKNQSSGDAGYLDAWGQVAAKPEFSLVPTELMFVSTHPSQNRENGSGSWLIVSADGKKDGETLVYGDRIHLKNLHPGAGYLDNCGWIKDMPVFQEFVGSQKFAVFTAASENRDNGTGTWIVGSNSKFDGSPVLEAASISLKNAFPGAGYLNAAGSVGDIPSFDDYDGSRLVFVQEPTANRRPNSGVWTIIGNPAVTVP